MIRGNGFSMTEVYNMFKSMKRSIQNRKDIKMEIEKLKQEYLNTLSELQNEILLLQSKIKKAQNDLINVKTKEDMDRFRMENDLEKDLKHIILFD